MKRAKKDLQVEPWAAATWKKHWRIMADEARSELASMFEKCDDSLFSTATTMFATKSTIQSAVKMLNAADALATGEDLSAAAALGYIAGLGQGRANAELIWKRDTAVGRTRRTVSSKTAIDNNELRRVPEETRRLILRLYREAVSDDNDRGCYAGIAADCRVNLSESFVYKLIRKETRQHAKKTRTR